MVLFPAKSNPNPNSVALTKQKNARRNDYLGNLTLNLPLGSRAMNKGMGEKWSILALHARIIDLEMANKTNSGFPTGQGKLGFVMTPGPPKGGGGESSGNSR